MINLYSTIKNSNLFSKIEVSELLFVEYTCMQEENKLGIWSNNNYFAFISSGKKAWKTIYNTYEVNEGDILFIKKGANLTHQFFDDTFCAVFVFIPDDFIKTFLKKNPSFLNASQKDLSGQDAVLRVEQDELLENYYHSIRSYLSLSQKPNENLLILKFEELLFSLFSNEKHRDLTDYFISLCQDQTYHMSRVMEENFAYNLKLEDYAQLCHMSLSTFKKTFKQYYHTTPAAWLQQKKLELAYRRILNTDVTISQVSLECGFEDPSHFIRVFKQKYYLTPLQFRQTHLKKVNDEI
ncbi:MAG TPA: AraC family transcriptional regulator [Chitinophagaceae bacterium]|nr:AraC family transcriptional regulator [Chitinophagaceae bacterium]